MTIAGVALDDGHRPEDRELAIVDADQRRRTAGNHRGFPLIPSDRLAEHWSFGEPVRPGESVTATINRFSPKDIPAEVWQRVEPVVKHTVTTVGFTDPTLARKACSIVGQLALWADRIGLPVDAESLFTPELIDRFITEGCTHLTDGTRLNYRSQLWRIGAAVVGHTLFPPRSVPLPASPSWPPYSPAEITELVSWSRGLPTESMRRESWALLALGLGAGLRSEEIVRAVGTDIHEEDGIVLIDVLGPGGRVDRVVPVRRDWAVLSSRWPVSRGNGRTSSPTATGSTATPSWDSSVAARSTRSRSSRSSGSGSPGSSATCRPAPTWSPWSRHPGCGPPSWSAISQFATAPTTDRARLLLAGEA